MAVLLVEVYTLKLCHGQHLGMIQITGAIPVLALKAWVQRSIEPGALQAVQLEYKRDGQSVSIYAALNIYTCDHTCGNDNSPPASRIARSNSRSLTYRLNSTMFF